MTLAHIILRDEAVKQVEAEIRKIKLFPVITIIDCRKQAGQYAIVTPKKEIWWMSSLPDKYKFDELFKNSIPFIG